MPLGAKAQSFRCSSSPHQTHFVGLWRGPYWRPPLDPRGNVLEEAGRAVCLPPRNGACDAITSAAALSLIPLPLRAALLRKTARLMQPPDFRLQIKLVILKVSTFSPHYVQYNRVRGNSAKHATDGPKSRKLHQCELVGPTHVSPPNPRIKSQNPKGGFGALWRVFLRYLSSRKERYRHRRSRVK